MASEAKSDEKREESGEKRAENSSPDTESASSLDDVSLNTSDGKEEEKNVKRYGSSVEEVKEMAAMRLQKELLKAQSELKLRDEEISKLSRIRTEMESELEELTASLFEEANNMVQKAHLSRSKAEKAVHEANMKIEVLEAEVKALKSLVLSSTSQQMQPNTKTTYIGGEKRQNGVRGNANERLLLASSSPHNSPRKSPSNYELGAKCLPSSALNEIQDECTENDLFSSSSIGEVDPFYTSEFTEWKKNPILDKQKSRFLQRIYDEEIYPVFNFKNMNLSNNTLSAIENNSIIVEPVIDKSSFPK
ncbi:Rab-3A-interacting protein-like protein [Dinothrombium tinctorium]|uniref:Rab-3A-interacting protein-like protein n=1 Tax=Dinothrombium tinctorium TaxID=1965070 RepID=A0A3S3S7R0_9ACAR|nr:Rab-3A-interacting protein-like protein [Dinothrombium tinctorium]RWS13680.1 Rab-3A-interacting protein-like protein [Dinothrombium tinctorium]